MKTNPVHSESKSSDFLHIKCIKSEKKIKKLGEYRQKLIMFIKKTEEKLKNEENVPQLFTEEFCLIFSSLPNTDEILPIFEIIQSK